MARGRFTREIEGYPVYDPDKLDKCLPEIREIATRRIAGEVEVVWGSELARTGYEPPVSLAVRGGRVVGRLVQIEDNSELGELTRTIGYEVWIPKVRKTVIVPGGDVYYKIPINPAISSDEGLLVDGNGRTRRTS